jgi:RNA polymerase sigma-70 factor (TIGR02943 family)
MEKEQKLKNWIMRYSDALYSYAKDHGFDDDGAKDMVQETFISAWRGMDRYRGETSAKNWLFLILKNKVTDHFRKAATKKGMNSAQHHGNDNSYFDEEGHWKMEAYPREWQVNLSELVEARDFDKVFNSCKSKLSEVQRAVFIMKYVDEMKSEDICRDLGITSSNYWVLLHRAKVQLRACLQKNWFSK